MFKLLIIKSLLKVLSKTLTSFQTIERSSTKNTVPLKNDGKIKMFIGNNEKKVGHIFWGCNNSIE